MSLAPAVTGLELKLQRVALRVKNRELAEAMGVDPSRISAIERQAYVTPETVERYTKALGTLRQVPTSVAS